MSAANNTAEEEKPSKWAHFTMNLAINAVLHPFHYAQTLMQLGYEPIPGRPGRTVFGKPALFLPNVLEYVGYIRKIDGWSGCYRGLAPKLVAAAISTTLSEKVVEYLKLEACDSSREPETHEELYSQFKVTLKRDIISTATGAFFAYPFHVISVRMMAQFVGSETIYNSIRDSIREIYRTNGISGFFRGLIPCLLFQVGCVILTSSVVYIFNKGLIENQTHRQHNVEFIQISGTFRALAEWFYTNQLYPLKLVSTCMIVTGSNLLISLPPNMPKYTGWIHCFNDLLVRGELKRGGALFWRSISLPARRNPSDCYFPMPALEPFRQKAF